MCPKARRSLSAVTVAYSELGNALCFVLACPTRPSCSRERIQELAIDFAIKTNNLREQPTGVIARWKAGARSWTQTWTLPPDQWPTSFYCFICSEIKLYTVWILILFEFFLGLFKVPKLRQAKQIFQSSSPSLKQEYTVRNFLIFLCSKTTSCT